MLRFASHRKTAGLVGMTALVALSACAPMARPTTDLTERPRAVEPAPKTTSIDNYVDDRAPVVEIAVGPDVMRPKRAHEESAWPAALKSERRVHSFNRAPLEHVLRALLSGSGIGIAVSDETAAAREVTLIDYKASVADAIDRSCRSAGVYCVFSDGVVEIRPTQVFSVTLPPVPEIRGEIKAGVERILAGSTGKSDVSLAEGAGTRLTYSATQDQALAIETYLAEMRSGALIIYETWIAEVALNESARRGIEFNKLSTAIGGGVLASMTGGMGGLGTASNTGAEALGFGAVYQGKRFSIDALAQFLGEHGTVNTIAAPQMAMLSGTQAEFRVGGTQTYVSQVGVLTNGTATGNIGSTVGNAVNTATGNYGSSLLNNTTQTKELELGTTLKINGVWQDGIVSTTYDLDITDLVRFTNVQTGLGTLQLPQTSKRALKNRVSLRPGDAILLGGIRSKRAQGDRSGLPGTQGVALPTMEQIEGTESELVIMLRPRVIVYRPASIAATPFSGGGGAPLSLAPPPSMGGADAQ